MTFAVDSRGTVIREGSKVAYNRSGDVIEGTVVRVAGNHFRIQPHPDFMQGRDDTKASRVRHGQSILVLHA